MSPLLPVDAEMRSSQGCQASEEAGAVTAAASTPGQTLWVLRLSSRVDSAGRGILCPGKAQRQEALPGMSGNVGRRRLSKNDRRNSGLVGSAAGSQECTLFTSTRV